MRLLVVWLVLAAAGCRMKQPQVNPQSPDQAFSVLKQLARAKPIKVDQIFNLLDRNSRWSVMSVFKDRQHICKLVRSHYPSARQAQELRRCRQAATSSSASEYFAAHARQHGLLAPLERLGDIDSRRKSEGRVELQSQGVWWAFCKEPDGWFYCGLAEHFNRLKVKASRDLATVRENVDAFRQIKQ